MRTVNWLTTFLLGAATLLPVINTTAQVNLQIYSDSLVNGFQDWSWNSTRDFSNLSPVHSGTRSVATTITASRGALRFQHPSPLDPTAYVKLSFWINGGPDGGQLLQVQAVSGNSAINDGVLLMALVPNTWQHYVIPLSTLGVTPSSIFNGVWLQDNSLGAQPTFYVDDVELIGAPPPAAVHVGVDNVHPLRLADARWFGLNTAIWDSNFDTESTSNAVRELGTKVLRFPGGSLSDEYHWGTGKSLYNTWSWVTSFSNFMHVATNTGVQAFITVNYGTGSSTEAADWVRCANITNACGFKYWEVGNECYGSWERDWNTNSGYFDHDPWSYAIRFGSYYNLMKAADPTIKIGVVATPGEDSYVNNTMHPVMNPRTRIVHNGWTPVMLYALKSMGVTPDFVVDHFYAEYQQDSDPTLLQAARNWSGDALDLRQQITDYMGSATGTNIEILCTENNADSGSQGRQSTSIVNGLYLADSLSQLMKTEINSFVWWDLRNGADFGGDFNSTLYGWRTYGDLGIMEGSDNKFPTYYAFKLMQYFVGTGDWVLNASSDYTYLSAYAARKADGNLALLVINKFPGANLTGQISLTNFVPWSAATVRSYGILQDEATRTNGPAALQDISLANYTGAGTDFTYSFPPYSLTLFTFAPFAVPSAPQLQVWSSAPGEIILQLQGQANVPYVIQDSSDLLTWTSRSTNMLTGSPLNITNPVAPGPGQKFWRALWQP